MDINNNALRLLLEELNQEPPESVVDQHQGNDYLPSSFIESELDRIFHGLWQVKNVQSKIVANEICVDVELWAYFYPVGEWIVKSGAGAAMIQQANHVDKQGNFLRQALPSEIDQKIKNTMERTYASALTRAMKNAAKRYGKRFGRDLTRKKVSPYLAPDKTIEEIKDLGTKLSEATTENELRQLWIEAGAPEEYSRIFNQIRRNLKKVDKLKLPNGTDQS